MPPPPTASPSFFLLIPAHEFHPSPSPPSPPPCLLLPSKPKPSAPWQARHLHAAAARSAYLAHTRDKCRLHLDHVLSVAHTVKESRRQASLARRRHLHNAQLRAEERRSRLLRNRAHHDARARARRASLLRERSARSKRDHLDAAVRARSEAQRRRGMILCMRSERAARFAPHAAVPAEMEALEDDTAALSLEGVSLEEQQQHCGKASPVDKSPQSVFAAREGLPASAPVPFPDMSSVDAGKCAVRAPVLRGRKGSKATRRAIDRIAGYYLLGKARAAMVRAGVLGQELARLRFEDCTARLETLEAQQSVDLVFRALGMRNRNRATTQKDAAREQMERRVLLSSIVVALSPEAVMEEKVRGVADAYRQPVSVDTWAVYSARRMLLCLHVGTLGAVADAWLQWRRAFLKWKRKDAAVLVRAMIEDAVATQALQKTVRRHFDEAQRQDRMQTSLGVSGSAVSDREREHAVWEEQLTRKQEKIKDAVLKVAGPRGQKRLQAALSASQQIADERIVHEIMIDLPGLLFRIQSSPPISDETWEQLQVELSQNPPERGELARRLVHLSDMLNAMVHGCFTVDRDHTADDLDADFAVRLVCRVAAALEKCQAEAFDDPLREWVNDTILKLQSAGANLVSIVVETLREMTNLVQKIHHAVSTIRIQRVAPVVQQFGAAWERSHLQGRIISGQIPPTFPQTRALFSNALEAVANTQNTNVQSTGPSACLPLKELLTHIIVNLAMKTSVCHLEELPEFMHLDLERIVKMQNDVQKCALLASLDNIAKQFASSKGVSLRRDALAEVAKVLDSDAARLVDIQNTFKSCVSTLLSERHVNLSNEEHGLLEELVERAARPGDKTFALMLERVRKALLTCSSRDQSDANSAAALSSNEALIPAGLQSVEEGLKNLSRGIAGLAQHLVQVHGDSLASIQASI